MIKKNTELLNIVKLLAAGSNSSYIILRHSGAVGQFKLIDRTHFFLSQILSGKNTTLGYYPKNEKSVLPYCSASSIYDLIKNYRRGTQRSEYKAGN